jgi:hypothetical protein
MTLLSAELEIDGDWGLSAPGDAAAVVRHMRSACLGGVPLLSDRQPENLRVSNHTGTYPSVWLHTDIPTTAWIHVIVGTRDWCNLAYQFGHELGHVFSNSWEIDARPRNPCQWLEEALVEAFSLRGLRLLADDWLHAAPFPDDADYSASILSYRKTILAGHREIGRDQGSALGVGSWYAARKWFLGRHGGLDAARGVVPAMLRLIEGDQTMVTDMGALNRWAGRSGVPLATYLDRWERSCAELKAPGRLPAHLRKLLLP